MVQRLSLRPGGLLREARLRHGLDQAELARRVGTAQPAISRLERNAVSPTVETLNRLLESMGETLSLRSLDLSAPVPGGGNQSLGELRADFRDLTPAQRLSQAAQLSEIATDLAAQAEP
jgi:transcriptional regulator with XRE-family HTH domain